MTATAAAPQSAGAAAPRGATTTIAALDGTPLAATHVAPTGPARGAALIVNGAMAVPQGYYAAFAQAAAARGFDVVTYDYRGIGASRRGSLRGMRAVAADWMRLDFEGVHRWVRRELDVARVGVVGHSFGGNAFGLAPSNHAIDAAVFVASQSGYWRLWPAPRRWVFGLLAHTAMPLLPRVFGYMPGWAGLGNVDVPREVMRDWARWCRDPRYAARDVAADYAAVRAPLKYVSIADDNDYAPLAAVRELMAMYANAPAIHEHVVPAAHGLERIGHFGFFRAANARLWPIALDWLAERLAHPALADPQSADRRPAPVAPLAGASA